MKPSNTGFTDPSVKTGTGVDWEREYLSAPDSLMNEESMDFVSTCEWAARIAIAEYRKELAAKVKQFWRESDVRDDASPFGYQQARGWAKLEALVLSLLNENDDE